MTATGDESWGIIIIDEEARVSLELQLMRVGK